MVTLDFGLDVSPLEGLTVDFPFALANLGAVIPVATSVTRVLLVPDGPALLALELQQDAPVSPCEMALVDNLSGHAFEAFGFPPELTAGQWVKGTINGLSLSGLFEVAVDPPVSAGFSGTPVWDRTLDAAVGVIVGRKGAVFSSSAALMAPTAVLAKAWPGFMRAIKPTAQPLTASADVFVGGESARTARGAGSAVDEGLEASVRETEDFISYLRSQEFSFSPTVDSILDEASRWVEDINGRQVRVSSSRLLFAMAELGTQPSSPQNAPGFLHQWFMDHPECRYSEARDRYLKSRVRILEPPAKRAMTENAYAILHEARRIAEEASRTTTVHARHVLGALLAYRAGPDGTKASKRLTEMGADLATLRRDLLDFVRHEVPADNPRAWEKALLLKEADRPPDETAVVEPPSGPSTHVARDRWTVDDSLGYFPYAYAIYRFLTDRNTQPPLAISIQAPWGGGKTSLMRMIQAQLDPKALEQAQQSPEHVNVRDLLAVARGATGTRFDVPEIKGGGQRRVTIWFNAWKYESTSQVWAGLADAIVRQIGERLGPVKRELFWFQLQLRRIDSGKVRRKVHEQVVTLFWERALPFLWLYVLCPVIASAVALVGRFLNSARWEHRGWATLVVSVAADAVLAIRQLVGSKSEVEGQPARLTLGEFVEAPDYNANLGFVHHVVEDLKRVFEIIPKDNLPMVIFIDDLDRCSPNKVADVVEAINLFLAGEFPECMFVLGIDDEMVAAALDRAHADVIAKLPGYAKSASLGWRFMDKFVQLPFVVPTPSTNELLRYASSLFSQDGNVKGIDMQSRDRAARVVEEGRNDSSPPENIVQEVAAAQKLDATQQEELKRDVQIIQEMCRNINRFSDEEATIKDLIREGARQFSNNPRDVKRFINVFRFHYFLRAARKANGEPIPSLEQLTRWIVLSLRWPDVVRWLRRHDDRRGRTVGWCLREFEKLGSKHRDAAGWRRGAESSFGLKAADVRWLLDEGLANFFRDEADRQERDRLSASKDQGLW